MSDNVRVRIDYADGEYSMQEVPPALEHHTLHSMKATIPRHVWEQYLTFIEVQKWWYRAICTLDNEVYDAGGWKGE